MRGLILSQFHLSGPSYAPICTPIAYIRETDRDGRPPYGEVSPGMEQHAKYMSLLHDTMHKSFVRFVQPIFASSTVDSDAADDSR
jgi:hypothetical protein